MIQHIKETLRKPGKLSIQLWILRKYHPEVGKSGITNSGNLENYYSIGSREWIKTFKTSFKMLRKILFQFISFICFCGISRKAVMLLLFSDSFLFYSMAGNCK